MNTKDALGVINHLIICGINPAAINITSCQPMTEQVARQANSVGVKQSACYWNAAMMCHAFGYTYCLGYAQSVIPLEHAWIEDKDGNVHDPTWEMHSDLGLVYAPILKMGRDDLNDYLALNNDLPPELWMATDHIGENLMLPQALEFMERAALTKRVNEVASESVLSERELSAGVHVWAEEIVQARAV